MIGRRRTILIRAALPWALPPRSQRCSLTTGAPVPTVRRDITEEEHRSNMRWKRRHCWKNVCFWCCRGNNKDPAVLILESGCTTMGGVSYHWWKMQGGKQVELHFGFIDILYDPYWVTTWCTKKMYSLFACPWHVFFVSDANNYFTVIYHKMRLEVLSQFKNNRNPAIRDRYVQDVHKEHSGRPRTSTGPTRQEQLMEIPHL